MLFGIDFNFFYLFMEKSGIFREGVISDVIELVMEFLLGIW